MIYRHILAAYDGSEASERALRHAIKLVEQGLGAKLSVIQAVSLAPNRIGNVTITPPEEYYKWLDEHTAEIKNHINEKVAQLPYCQTVVPNGDPANEILTYAYGNNCDLIVMGSRGFGMIREMMFGSVSHHVVYHARIPVLIVK